MNLFKNIRIGVFLTFHDFFRAAFIGWFDGLSSSLFWCVFLVFHGRSYHWECPRLFPSLSVLHCLSSVLLFSQLFSYYCSCLACFSSPLSSEFPPYSPRWPLLLLLLLVVFAGGAGVIVSGVDVAVAGCGGAATSPRIASQRSTSRFCAPIFGIFHNEGGPPPDVHPCCICCKEGIWDIPMIKTPPCGISCTLWCACPRVSAMFGRPPQMPLVQPTLFVVRSFGDLCESPLHHLSLRVPILSLSLFTRWSLAR